MMEMMNGFLGDRVLVNGLPQPTTEVDAAWHRVRVVNASNARIYKLAWSRDVQMAVIGGDGGLLETPVPSKHSRSHLASARTSCSISQALQPARKYTSRARHLQRSTPARAQ